MEPSLSWLGILLLGSEGFSPAPWYCPFLGFFSLVFSSVDPEGSALTGVCSLPDSAADQRAHKGDGRKQVVINTGLGI